MNIKRILSGALAATMLAASGAAFAEEAAHDIMLISADPTAEETAAAGEAPVFYDKVEMYGTADIKEDGLYIIDTAEIAEVQLNMNENTIFVDANGYKTALESIGNGASLKVIASAAMTMSIPPQTYAHVVMVADENGGFPIYAEVSAVTKDEDGNTVLSSKDGNYEIVYAEETTALEPFATKNIVNIADVKEGTRLLVNASVMTMSIPAVVPAERIVILPEETAAQTPAIPEKVLLNGKELATAEIAAQIIDRDGAYLLPVRAICEAAGLEVAWDAELQAITVGTIPMGVTFNIGVNSYTKARMAHQTLSSAPILENDRTYVPIDFFTQILGATAETADGVINITIE